MAYFCSMSGNTLSACLSVYPSASMSVCVSKHDICQFNGDVSACQVIGE